MRFPEMGTETWALVAMRWSASYRAFSSGNGIAGAAELAQSILISIQLLGLMLLPSAMVKRGFKAALQLARSDCAQER
jgi:hypothetical protein